ncbi:hypothetical protein Pfo_026688 [Paulownia fortunei]|nr:hypothetical protein Pfo_026688 [Paulownia fortunei]
METAKRWFGKFGSKEKPKTSSKKKEPTPNGKEEGSCCQAVYRKALQGADEESARTEGAVIPFSCHDWSLYYFWGVYEAYLQGRGVKRRSSPLSSFVSLVTKNCLNLFKIDLVEQDLQDQRDWFRSIVNWRTHLKFPEEAKLSPEAKDLICKLSCNVEKRLGTRGADEIKAHPWFKGIEWDKLYQIKAAFIPEVNDELDTQNFEKFEESDNQVPSTTKSGPWRKMLSSMDVNFMGHGHL